jgi:hypothetical protein
MSGGSGRTFPAFGELQVAHQIVGHVHEARLDLGARQPDSPDALSAHAVVLVADDVLDAGTDIAMLAAVGLASGRLKVG